MAAKLGAVQREVAEWQVSGCNLISVEQLDTGPQGYLGVDYTTGVDTRWKDRAFLGPAINTITLSANDVNSVQAESGTLGASEYAYIGGGTTVSKVKLSDMSVISAAKQTLAEACTDLLYTQSQSGTEEVSIGMAATAYKVITAVGTSTDTVSTNSASQLIRVFGDADDRIVGGKGQSWYQNILSGTVTMASPNWQTVTTIQKNVTPKSFAKSAGLWILGTDYGPYLLDSFLYQFFPLLPELSQDANHCRVMGHFFAIGTVICLANGTRNQQGVNGQSFGVERFLSNNSPVSGRPTGWAATSRWGYQSVYNAFTGDSYILAWRPRQIGDPHSYLMTPYVLAKFSSKQCNYLRNIETKGGRTLTTIMGGYGDDAFWMQEGRAEPYVNDTSYTFSTSGTLYLTELRREPHFWKYIDWIEFETANCSSSNTVTCSITCDGGETHQIGGPITDNGIQRLQVREADKVYGWRIKPQLAFAGASDSTPQVIGTVRVGYRLMPMRINGVYLDEENP